MRKVILDLAVSLDGFIEGPKGEIDWIPFTEETGIELINFMNEIDAIIYGRVSYEMWGSYIPGAESSDFEKEFYEIVSKKTKYVCTTDIEKEFDGNPIIIANELAATINKLRAEQGKDIWLFGGARLITSFANLQLIDEIRLAIMPVILGAGKPLFQDIKERINLNLLRTNSDKHGVTSLYYEVVK